MSGFEVTSAELRAHLTPLSQIQADLKRCREAADQVGYGGDEAYGYFVLRLAMPNILELCLGDSAKMVDTAADLVEAFHKGIEANNASYLATEEAIRKMWDEAKG